MRGFAILVDSDVATLITFASHPGREPRCVRGRGLRGRSPRARLQASSRRQCHWPYRIQRLVPNRRHRGAGEYRPGGRFLRDRALR